MGTSLGLMPPLVAGSRVRNVVVVVVVAYGVCVWKGGMVMWLLRGRLTNDFFPSCLSLSLRLLFVGRCEDTSARQPFNDITLSCSLRPIMKECVRRDT